MQPTTFYGNQKQPLMREKVDQLGCDRTFICLKPKCFKGVEFLPRVYFGVAVAFTSGQIIATGQTCRIFHFLARRVSFVPSVPHSSSLDSMSEEDIDRVLEPVRQQVFATFTMFGGKQNDIQEL